MKPSAAGPKPGPSSWTCFQVSACLGYEEVGPRPPVRSPACPGGLAQPPALPQHPRPGGSWGGLPAEGAEEHRCQGLPSQPSPRPQIQPRGGGTARLAAGGLAAPHMGQPRAAILFAHTATGLCSARSPGAVFPEA